MTAISIEQLKKSVGALPENVRAAFLDDRTSSTLWRVGERSHLSEEKTRIVARLTGYIILGFSHEEDLAHEIEKALQVDHRLAASLSEEISKYVIKPVLAASVSPNVRTPHVEETPNKELPREELLSPGFREKIREEEQAQTTAENVIEESIPQRNVPPLPPKQTQSQVEVQPPQMPQPQTEPAATQTPHVERQEGPAPFVLHKEEEIEPLARDEMSPLDRPQFFKSTATEKPQQAPSTARLEIGEEVVAPIERVGRTKEETPRVVNYSGPVAEIDPFRRPQTAKSDKTAAPEPKQPSKEVSPENIVNLKDLPK